MKNPAKYFRAIPIDLQGYFRPFLYGLVGGSAAVAFQLGIKLLEWRLWTRLSQIAGGKLVFISLVTISSTSFLAGLILTYVSREAAGSGIPQLKIAFWRDFGYLPFKVAFAKFFAGIITIGGGCSLGREGPSIHLAGALASNIARMLGVAKQGRRAALLSGAAAGLAAAFNTPLSAITFVMEEIVEDLNNTIFLAQTLVASRDSDICGSPVSRKRPGVCDSSRSPIFLDSHIACAANCRARRPGVWGPLFVRRSHRS